MKKWLRVLTREQLEKLTIQRLLTYKNMWLKTHDTADFCIPSNGWSKQHPEWKAHYALIKDVLNTRVNIE